MEEVHLPSFLKILDLLRLADGLVGCFADTAFPVVYFSGVLSRHFEL